MNAAALTLTGARNATAGSRKDAEHIHTGKGRKEGMIALAGQKQGQEERVTSYRFGDDERELTAGEKEAYAMAGSIAEKIHCAGLAAAAAQFSRMTYKEFKRAYRLPEWVKPEEYYSFSKSFYQAYCWGYEEGEKMKEHQFDIGKEEKEKRLTGNR